MLLFSKSKNNRAARAWVKKLFKIDKDTVLLSTVNFELTEIPKIIEFALQKFHTKCCTNVFMGIEFFRRNGSQQGSLNFEFQEILEIVAFALQEFHTKC
jgi:hypothetical protein